MGIEQLNREESLDFMSRKRLVRLGCTHDNQPYVIPIYIAREGERLYAFTMYGQKIEWMRANPLVCVEADEMESLQKWCSVIGFGRYVELPKIPQMEQERRHAHALLCDGAHGWEPGYARTILHGKQHVLEPLHFRIDLTQIWGRRATPDRAETDTI